MWFLIFNEMQSTFPICIQCKLFEFRWLSIHFKLSLRETFQTQLARVFVRNNIQSKLCTTTTLGAKNSGHCSKVAIIQGLIMKSYYILWLPWDLAGRYWQVAAVWRWPITQVWLYMWCYYFVNYENTLSLFNLLSWTTEDFHFLVILNSSEF